MKIASFHKKRGDKVYFCKGKNEIKKTYDVIYITSLFTFYYKETIDTINYFEENYDCQIYVGGIAATILPEKFMNDFNSSKTILLKGQLLDSSIIGFECKTNIDLLPLDYDILFQTKYVYTSNEGYISYTTRGCINKCPFCAVPILEAKFCISDNLVQQINEAENQYGKKKNLLLLDNNILGLKIDEISRIVNEILTLGFNRKDLFFDDFEINKLIRRIDYLYEFGEDYIKLIEECLNKTISLLEEKANKHSVKKFKINIEDICQELSNRKNSYEKFEFIKDKKEEIEKIYISTDLRRGQKRKVDFNQGMDARLLTEDKMKILSQIPIEPFRLALDDVKTIDVYIKAVHLAARYGIKVFSNYLLYNYKDSPEDLFERLILNVELANELNVNIYSFPMKYADIENTHRNNIGENWNKYFLANFRRILKPTMGVVGKGKSYFYRAFGRDSAEFIDILSMPFDLLTYRDYFEQLGITEKWRVAWEKLKKNDKDEILYQLSKSNYAYNHPIMKYYRIRKE